MFDFDIYENNTIKQLERRVSELDNQVKHWKSMYEREVRKRPVIVKYENSLESNKRLKKVLKLHHDTKDEKLKQTLIESLYMDYGIIEEPTDALYNYWVREGNE